MLTIPVVKATSSPYWQDFGLRATRDDSVYHPSGCKFAEHVEVKLGLDHDDCVAAFEMRLAPCLADHPVLSIWGAQLLGATLAELRDPAFQELAERLKEHRGGPWLTESRQRLEGFDSELVLERQPDHWVQLRVCLTEYVGCACGLYNAVTARKCSRCKASVGKKSTETVAATGGGGGWWPFGRKS